MNTDVQNRRFKNWNFFHFPLETKYIQSFCIVKFVFRWLNNVSFSFNGLSCLFFSFDHCAVVRVPSLRYYLLDLIIRLSIFKPWSCIYPNVAWSQILVVIKKFNNSRSFKSRQINSALFFIANK